MRPGYIAWAQAMGEDTATFERHFPLYCKYWRVGTLEAQEPMAIWIQSMERLFVSFSRHMVAFSRHHTYDADCGGWSRVFDILGSKLILKSRWNLTFEL